MLPQTSWSFPVLNFQGTTGLTNDQDLVAIVNSYQILVIGKPTLALSHHLCIFTSSFPVFCFIFRSILLSWAYPPSPALGRTSLQLLFFHCVPHTMLFFAALCSHIIYWLFPPKISLLITIGIRTYPHSAPLEAYREPILHITRPAPRHINVIICVLQCDFWPI